LTAIRSLVVWLARRLRDWEPGAPARGGASLEELLDIAWRIDVKGKLWLALGPLLEPNRPLLAGAARIVAAAEFPLADVVRHTPLEDPERLAQLKIAAASHDWQHVTTVSGYLGFGHHSLIDRQALRLLCATDETLLAEALDGVKNSLAVAEVVYGQPAKLGLHFARSCNSPALRFWAMFRSLGEHPLEASKSLTDGWQILLEQTMGDVDEWRQWMKVLVSSPGRFPSLQPALGQALCRASAAAIESYFGSMDLGIGSTHGREAVAACLEVVRLTAPALQRQKIWQIAYERWRQWGFGSNGSFEPTYPWKSPVDFAVVGYFVECCSHRERAAEVARLTRSAESVKRNWFSSQPAQNGQWFRQISAFQPLAHAMSVVDDGRPWLQTDNLYEAPWDDGTRYTAIQYPGFDPSTLLGR
jgi:hypothetical protein